MRRQKAVMRMEQSSMRTRQANAELRGETQLMEARSREQLRSLILEAQHWSERAAEHAHKSARSAATAAEQISAAWSQTPSVEAHEALILTVKEQGDALIGTPLRGGGAQIAVESGRSCYQGAG